MLRSCDKAKVTNIMDKFTSWNNIKGKCIIIHYLVTIMGYVVLVTMLCLSVALAFGSYQGVFLNNILRSATHQKTPSHSHTKTTHQRKPTDEGSHKQQHRKETQEYSIVFIIVQQYSMLSPLIFTQNLCFLRY